MKLARVLVSNRALPSSKIGSWTTRMEKFIDNNPDFFLHILSPTDALKSSLYCKKGNFITWKKSLRNIQLLRWVSKDYIKALKRLSKTLDKLVIVVMDDQYLLQSITLIKSKLKCEVELVFSFHGFNLNLDDKVLKSVDKILWLSQLAHKKNRLNYESFPNSIVVGNAVDSQLFYPLSFQDYKSARKIKGYKEDEEILIWMANDRPKKGFHIFKEITNQLLKRNKEIKIILIGTSQVINHPNVFNVGRIPNNEVAKYLQIGSYYMFTTLYEEGFGLSLIEAYKSGNAVITTSKGAIPEVLAGLDYSYQVEDEYNFDLWLNKLEQARKETSFGKLKITEENASSVWSYDEWEGKFYNAIA
ncbi:MAG: glycosyltransferase family 4 protein [Winogradskyella sp.]|uniref:glycosyltransferase family 4 protein n=1 Tax=Winogradskyella sp. TaxID=1883156 RepID=UPI0025E11FD7|nr:glycosyltransferase family 4 protein [Winogradskyella sp.]NRB59409.1 glycosyltransferase family 4 protein [Winogradskyella sp.]